MLHAATGVRIALDDLAKLNLGKSKTDDPRMVPQLWRSGQHDRVKSYLRSDVELTRDLYQFGLKAGALRYTHKDWQRGTQEIREVRCPWAAPTLR